MPAPRVSDRRLVAEVVIGSGAVVGCGLITLVGVAQRLLTALQAASPCGETYRDRPGCVLAAPDAVALGYLMIMAVPAVCTLVGLIAGVLAFARWRRAILPTALALAVAITAFLIGLPMLSAALRDAVPA